MEVTGHRNAGIYWEILPNLGIPDRISKGHYKRHFGRSLSIRNSHLETHFSCHGFLRAACASSSQKDQPAVLRDQDSSPDPPRLQPWASSKVKSFLSRRPSNRGTGTRMCKKTRLLPTLIRLKKRCIIFTMSNVFCGLGIRQIST